jgi:formylglycine-generating enzyme
MEKVIALGLCCCSISQISAAEARFFRLVSRTPTTLTTPATITTFARDGFITWTNAQTNVSCVIQTSTNQFTGWTDYVQVPVTGAVMSLRLFDPAPPSGMALIPAGTFVMGDTFDEFDRPASHPCHSVYVGAFYMDRFEVTKGLWDEVHQWATNHGYNFNHGGTGKAANHPVHVVSWYDMVKWCNARSEKEGLLPAFYTSAAQTKVYRTGSLNVRNDWVNWNAGYRLPTEVEWEKAARGGLSGKRFPWGDTITHGDANYYSSEVYTYDLGPTRGYDPSYEAGVPPYTSPVGSFAPNGYGLHDMAGNVWEWCWDSYDSQWYSNLGASQDDTRGPDVLSGVRVLRGGAWFNIQMYSQCADRFFYFPSYGLDSVGFRCVRGTSLD